MNRETVSTICELAGFVGLLVFSYLAAGLLGGVLMLAVVALILTGLWISE